jgi:hypothetical protein
VCRLIGLVHFKALEAEVAVYLETHRDERDGDGR